LLYTSTHPVGGPALVTYGSVRRMCARFDCFSSGLEQ
jgi:hypothetical protein